MTKLVDAEGQIGGAAAAKDEKFEELKAARAELAKARSKVTGVAREATARVEEANDKLRDAETALAATDNHLGRIVRDLGKIADEIELQAHEGHRHRVQVGGAPGAGFPSEGR